MQKHVLDAEDAAVGRQRDFGIVGLAALMRGGEEMLEPVLDPFDRAIEFSRRPRDHHLLGIEQHDLRAEAAADKRRDHAHLPLAHAQHGGKPVAQEYRRLRRVPDRELISARIPIGDNAARLDRRRRAVIVVEAAGDDAIGLGTRGGVVAAALPDMGGDIAAHVIVDGRGRAAASFFKIDDGGERFKLDGNVAERILGEVAAVRQHDGERLADMADFVLGERHLRALIEDRVLDRRRRHEQRAGRPIIAEIGRGIDGDDTVAGARRRHIDRADAGVRDVAAQKSRIDHAGKLDVVDEQRLAAKQPRVLIAADRSAETTRGHDEDPRSRSAASCIASTMC